MSLPICIVGAGSIGMRHIGCAMASEKIDLTAVVEAYEPARARLLAEGLPVVARLDAVPAYTRAAVVATPTPDHYATALACLDRGWAVLVEKPVTEALEDARRLCDRAETLGLPLIAGHHRRCHPFVAEARLRMAELGQLVAVQGIWALRKHDSYYDPDWRRAPGAGPILTNLSHEIDLLHFLAGEITEVAALTAHTARGFEIEDTVALSLRFANGALGSFTMSDAGASPWAFEAATGENPDINVRGSDPVRFIGTRGALAFPSLRMWQGGDWRNIMTETPGPVLPKVDGIALQLDRFAAIAAGEADEILATGRDGARAIAVLDAVQFAARTGQTQQITQEGRPT